MFLLQIVANTDDFGRFRLITVILFFCQISRNHLIEKYFFLNAEFGQIFSSNEKRLGMSTVIVMARLLRARDSYDVYWRDTKYEIKKSRTDTALTMLSNRVSDYWYISQGKTRIPGVNDSMDMETTDVSPALRVSSSLGEIQILLVPHWDHSNRIVKSYI